jgi:hypothetical protein
LNALRIALVLMALVLAAATGETAEEREGPVRELLAEAKRLDETDARAALAKIDEALSRIDAGSLWAPGEQLQLRFDALTQKCWLLAVEAPAEAVTLVAVELAAEDASATPASEIGLADLRLCRGYTREQRGEVEAAAADYERAVADGERLAEHPNGNKLLASAVVLRARCATTAAISPVRSKTWSAPGTSSSSSAARRS